MYVANVQIFEIFLDLFYSDEKFEEKIRMFTKEFYKMRILCSVETLDSCNGFTVAFINTTYSNGIDCLNRLN